MMQITPKTRSILEELDMLSSKKDVHLLVESRATHAITSVINLFTLIRESYSAEEADELERRLINSIRSGDTRKFSSGLRKIKESRRNAK